MVLVVALNSLGVSGQLPECSRFPQHQTSLLFIWDKTIPRLLCPTNPPTRDAVQSPVSKGIFVMNTKPARGDT